MGKGVRNRKNRHTSRKLSDSHTDVLTQTGSLVPLPPETWRTGSLCWLTGVLWKHNKHIVEPFLAEYMFGSWRVLDLDVMSVEYQYAKLLIASKNLMVYNDRLDAITVCDAMQNEKTLLDGFMEFMPKEALQEYLNNKVGGV